MYSNFPPSASWIPIDPAGAITAGTTYTSPSLAGAGFKRLWLSVSTSSGAAGYAAIALTGLSGTYRRAFSYVNGAGTVAGVGTDVWTIPMDAPSQLETYMFIGTGRRRMLVFDSYGSGGPFSIHGNGDHDDTTNAVTGLTLTLAASGTATVTLMGMR